MAGKNPDKAARKFLQQRGLNALIAAQYGDYYGILGGVNETRAASYVPPGSVSDVLRRARLTRAMSEGTAASSDARDFGSYGYSTRHDDIEGD